MDWLGGAVRRWIALMSLVATIAGIAALASEAGREWAWLAIGGLALLVVSLAWTARDEYRRRVAAETATHQPPGGGLPVSPPVEYQVDALRQVIPRMAGAGLSEFGYWELREVFKNLPAAGHRSPVRADHRIRHEGLARLVELGQLEASGNGRWRVPTG